MTRVLLASLVIFMLGCGMSEPVSVKDTASNQDIKTTRQDPLRPPADWKNRLGDGPRVSELSLGRISESPWVFNPRNDLPDWEFSLPLDWSVDPFKDRSWQHHLHSWRTMEYWLHEYRREGDIASLLIPIEIVLDWHRFHVEEGRTSEFQWYDHSTGVRASRLAFLLELILSDQIVVNDTDLARLMTLADLHVQKLMEPEFLNSGNHGAFQLVGLDALCSVVGWRTTCQGARIYSKEAFVRLVQSWYSEQGVHVENSPTYHGWVTRQIRILGAVERFQPTFPISTLQGLP